MRIFFAAAIAALGFSGPALANGHVEGKCFDKASLSYVDCPGGYDWSGFYIGAHVGYAETGFDGLYDDTNILFDVSADGLDVSGLAYGGQAGYNYQFPSNLVLGIEVDVSALNGDDTVFSTNQSSFITAEQKLAASARLRLGYAMGAIMPYVTGGVGMLDYELLVNETGNQQSFDETAIGAVVGGGLEFMLTENILLRGEGLYYFLDDDNALTNPPFGFLVGGGSDVGVDDFWTVRGGVSYKF